MSSSSKPPNIAQAITLTVISDWATTLALIFGGCCSNALTLEQITNQHPHVGSLLTFAQFLLISLNGLPKFVTFTPYPRLRPRQIPILPYLAQVFLFYCISLLNNAAFAYNIPMSVHIIFRSGGMVISMLLGWIILGRRYSLTQILSIALVTVGVVMTTLSASHFKPNTRTTPTSSEKHTTGSTSTYFTGIAILTLALILSGFLGIVQDKTYAQYGRRNSDAKSKDGKQVSQSKLQAEKPETWEESMFYLHFLSMPMFLSVRKDILTQLRDLASGPSLSFSLPSSLQTPLAKVLPVASVTSAAMLLIPMAFVPLLLNTITQLFCVSGVHRLTSRVSALTVTLVLVVRKAVSLVISVLLFGAQADAVGRVMLWGGATLVFVGTVGYSLGASGPNKPTDTNTKAKKD